MIQGGAPFDREGGHIGLKLASCPSAKSLEELMTHFSIEHGGASIAGQIQTLPDPYRGNAIEWLRTCTQSPLENLEEDIELFLQRLHPTVRNQFLIQTHRLLDTAKYYFGAHA
jgi:hypothetical protein